MQKPASLARRLSRVSTGEKTAKPIEIMEIVEGAQCTAAYIAQLTGDLTTLANGARFAKSGASPRPRPARSRALVVPRQLTSVACFLAPNHRRLGMPLAAPRMRHPRLYRTHQRGPEVPALDKIRKCHRHQGQSWHLLLPADSSEQGDKINRPSTGNFAWRIKRPIRQGCI
jgi:hypothetical protein